MKVPVLWFALLLLSGFWTINGSHYEDDFLDPSDIVNYDPVSQTMRKNTELIYSVLKKHLQRTLDEIQRLSLFPDMEKHKFFEAQRLTEVLKLLEDKDVDPVILERELNKVQILHKQNIDSSWKSRIKDLVLTVLQDSFRLADTEKSKFLEAQQLTEIANLLEDKDMDHVSLNKDLKKVLILHKQNIDSSWNIRIEDLVRVILQNTIMLTDEKSNLSKISKLLEDKDRDPALLERELKEVLVLHKQNIDTFWKSKFEDLVHAVLQNTFALDDHGDEYRVTASGRMKAAVGLISKFLEDNARDRETLEKDLKKVLLQLKQDQFLTWGKKYEETHNEEIQHGFLTSPFSSISKVLGHLKLLSYIGPTVLFLLLFLMYLLMPGVQNLEGRREEHPNEDDDARPVEDIHDDVIPDDNIQPNPGNQEPQDEPEDQSLKKLWPLPQPETQTQMPGVQNLEGRREEHPNEDDDARPVEDIHDDVIPDDNIQPNPGNQEPQDEPEDQSLTKLWPLAQLETQPQLNPQRTHIQRGASNQDAREDLPKPAKSEKHRYGPSVITTCGADATPRPRERKNKKDKPAEKTKCYEDTSTSSTTEPKQHASEVDPGDHRRRDVEDLSFAGRSNEQEDHFPAKIKAFSTFSNSEGAPARTQCYEDSTISSSPHDSEAETMMSDVCNRDRSQRNSVASSIATQSYQQRDSFTPEIKSNVGIGTPTETRGFYGDAAHSTSIHDDGPKSLKSENDSQCSFNVINSATLSELQLERVPEKNKNDTPAACASRNDALYLRPVPLQSEINHGGSMEDQSGAFSHSYVTNFPSSPDAKSYSMCDVSHNTSLRDHDPTNRFSEEAAQNSSTLGSQSFELIEESGQFSTDT